MRLRQEQLVFGAAVLVLGLLVAGQLGGEAPSRAPRRGSSQGPELAHHPAPDVARALPFAREPLSLQRALFQPPRDTEKLPPLALEAPPRMPLPALRPPAAFGPAPALFHRFLRTAPALGSAHVPGLFEEPPPPEDLAGGDDPAQEGAEGAVSDEAAVETVLTAQERVAQVQAYKRVHDWLKMPSYHWGRIQNRDRLALAQRPTEPVLWLEVDPATGAERFPGQGAIEIARERVDELGFAETPENAIELARLPFRGALTPGQYPRVLELANWCVSQHPDARNALAIAEELYGRAREISGGHPEALLGLARCHEAGFQFEQAFQIYSGLIEGGQAEHPLVLARFAGLLARFRLFARARELLAQAERFGRTEWEVQWAYGRFELEQGNAAEAQVHLEQAARYEPNAPERTRERSEIRSDLASALLLQGDLAGASSWFRKALQADSTGQRAMAGLSSIIYLEGGDGLDGDAALVAETELEGSGADLLLASGLVAFGRGELGSAIERFELAAAADPLRASLARRALSSLAEQAGYPEEALQFAEEACENDPTDVYALIQRARLLAAREDFEGASESFTRALDIELALPDVAAAMGEIRFRLGQHEDAERYLEAAILLDDSLAAVHTLRGLNRLALSQAKEAEESFQRALTLDRLDPTAQNGRAWCAYVLGDSIEAQTLFRELDDALRDRPEDDPNRAYARAQIARITDHEEKVVWTDRFERAQIMNNWSWDEDVGPKVTPQEGAVRIEGAFTGPGRSRLRRDCNAGDFVSFEARVTVRSGSRARVGVFAALETASRGQTQVRSEVTLSRHPDGQVQSRFLRRGEDDLPYEDVPVIAWPLDRAVVLRIERYGESSDTRFRVSVDGIPVVEDVRVPTMGSTGGALWIGVFAEGEPGRSVVAEIDDVQVVKRQR